MANVSYNFGSPTFTPIIKEATNQQFLSFDGVNGLVEIPHSDSLSLPNAFTIEAWVNPAEIKNTWQPLITKEANNGTERNYGLFINPNNLTVAASFLQSDNIWTGFDSGISLKQNEWNHLAMTFDGSTLKLYINGELDKSQNASGNALQNTHPVKIGNEISNYTPFAGKINDVRIWNVARTQAEIQNNSNTTFNGTEAGLAGYWNFDGDKTNGAIVTDATANGNDGTLNNGVKFEIDESFIGYADIVLDQPVTVAPGAIIEYQIEGASTATQQTDFYNAQLDISTTDGTPPTNSVFIPQGENTARIHLTALSDAVAEGDENIKITLLSGTDDFGGTYTVANNREVLSFNGTGDYVEIPDSNSLDLPNAFTIETWVNPAEIKNTWQPLITKQANNGTQRNYGLFIAPNNLKVTASFFESDGTGRGFDSGISLKQNEWNHVAMTFDGSTLKLYINGELDKSQNASGTPFQNSHPVKIGKEISAYTPFAGEMDEARIWNKARTQDEIRQNMYGSLTGNEAGLAGYWSFDSASVSGNTITDLSSNNNNGTTAANNREFISLNGTSDYVEIPDDNAIDFAANQNFTVESWVKAGTQALGGFDDRDLIEKWDETDGRYPYVIRYIRSTGKIVAARYDGSNVPVITSTATINDGQYHHIAFVKDGSDLKLYIDGQLDGTTTDTTTGNTQNTSSVFVGMRGNNINHFNGEVSELRIWNDARTQTEIQNNLYTRMAGNEAGLAGYWTFAPESVSGNTIDDLTANNNNGTKNGGSIAASSDQSATYFVQKSADPSVTFLVEDSPAYQAGIAFSDRFGDQITASNKIVADSQGKATFQVKLTSEPTNNVTINLTAGNGTLNNNSLTFNANNWDTYQTVNVTGLGATFNNFNVSTSVTSSDSNYSSLSNSTLGVIDSTPTDTTKIKVTEGAAEQDIPPITAEINATQDALEGQPEPGQFAVNLSDTAPQGGYVVPYQISGTGTQGTDYNLTTSDNSIQLGKSLNLDGTNDYVELGGNATTELAFQGSKPYTIAAWVKPDGGGTIISKFNGGVIGSHILFVQNSGQITAHREVLPLGNLTSNTAIPFGQWSHVASTYDGTTLKIYINGELAASQAMGAQSTNTQTPVLIGALQEFGNPKNLFPGSIDEVQIWDTARTEDQILQNMHSLATGNEAGLVGYWNFNSDSNTTATDLSSNNYDGTLNNGASFVDNAVLPTMAPGLVKIDAGQTSANIGIEAIDNQTAQGDKTVTITVGGNNPGSQATLNIKDDETAGAIELAQLSKTGTIEVPAIKLEVTTAYNPTTGTIGLKIAEGAQSYTFEADTTITFTNGVEITIPAGTTLGTSATTVTVAPNLGNIPTTETSTTDNRLLDVGIVTYDEDPGTGNVTANVRLRLTKQPAGNVSVTLTDANGSDSATFNFTNSNWNQYQQTNANNFLELIPANNAVALTADIGGTNTINLPLSGNLLATPLGNNNTGNGSKLITTEGERVEFTATKAYDANAGTVELELFNRSADYTVTAGQVIVFDNGTQAEVTTDTALKFGEAKAVPVTLTQGTAIPVDQEGSVVLAPGETTVAVRLSAQPASGDVVLDLVLGDSTEGEFINNGGQTKSLTFTQGNWEQYQEVTVKGIDDAIDDGNIAYNLDVSGASSNADTNYRGPLQSLEITNEDNDRAPDITQTINNLNQPPIIASLSVDKTQVNENGTVAATFDLNRPAPTGGLNVEYEVIGQTASVLEDVQIPIFLGDNNPLALAKRKSWSEVSGFWSFGSPGDVPPGIVPSLADVDGDGDLDAFAGESSPFNSPGITIPNSEGMTYYENTGTASAPVFVKRTGNNHPLNLINSSVSGSSAPAFIDIGNDGDLDAFVGDVLGKIHYFENTGNATFVQRTGANNPLNAINNGLGINAPDILNPTFVDIDSDGDLDFFGGLGNTNLDSGGVFADFSTAAKIIYFENQGNDTFVRRTGADNPLDTLHTNNGFNQVAFGDIDLDGDFDAFIGDGKSGQLTYLRNIGTATNPFFENAPAFNPFAGISVGKYARIALTDINNDNQLEAFIGNENGSIVFYELFQSTRKVYIQEGQSAGTVNIKTTNDNIAENKENFSVQVVDKSDEGSVNERITLEVSADYEVQTLTPTNIDGYFVGLQIQQSSTLPQNMVTEGDRLKITNAFDSGTGQVTLDINNSSSSIALAAGDLLTFKNGTVIEVSTATTVLAGTPQAVDVILKEVPTNNIPQGTQLTFNDGSKVTVAENVSISAFESTSVQVEQQTTASLQPNAGDTTELSRSNRLRTFVNLDVTNAYDGTTDNNLRLQLNETQPNTFTLTQGTQLSFNNGQTIVTVASDTDINSSTATAVPVTTTSSVKTIAVNETTTTSTPFEANITINDNDTAGARITSDAAGNNVVSGTFNTTEAGGEKTFYVRLETEPTEPVSVFVGSSNKEEGLLGGQEVIELQFDRTNWKVPQAFTVTGVDDPVDDGNVTYNLKTTVESRGDLHYREGAIDIEVLQGLSSGSVQLELDELNIERAQLPAGTSLNFSNGTVATVDSTKTLDNDETNAPVDVSVTIDTNALGFGATNNSGSWQVTEAYDNTLNQVELRNTTGNPITLTKDQTVNFSNGAVLRIDADITIAENSRDQAKATLTTAPNVLPVLAAGTTNNNGNFEVTATYDNSQKQVGLKNTTGSSRTLNAGDVLNFTDGTSLIVGADVTIAANSSSTVSAALGVSGLTTSFIKDISKDVNLSNTDNDTASLVLVNVEEIAAKEGVANNFYKVELKTQPTDTVTIVMTPSDDQIALEGKMAGEPLTITYDATNWNVPQTIGVTAIDDFEVEFDHTTNIAFDASQSADSVYAGLDVSNARVKVNIIDNDLPTASVLSAAGAIEANAPGYFAINLDKPLPNDYDDTGLKVNYTVSGTSDTNGSGATDDLQPIASGSARIAPGEMRTPLIAFPIDDFKAEGVPLDVTTAYSGGSIGLQIKNNATLPNSFNLQAGTELTFSNGAIATVDANATVSKTSATTVNLTIAPESSLATIPTTETTRIPAETVIVEVTAGTGYEVSSDENIATLEIEDNDVPGVRVVEASERTTVTEGEAPAEYFISLLSEPANPVTVNIAPVQTTRNLTVTADLSGGTVGLQVNDADVDSLRLSNNEVITFSNGATATVDGAQFVSSDSAGTSIQVKNTSGTITTSQTGEYSYDELTATNSLTFNSNNWYKLQPVSVTGLDDNVAEIGNTHEATLTYTVTSSDTDYSGLKVPAQTISIIDRPFDPNTTASSLTQGLLAFQDSLDTLSLPLIGTLEGTAPPFINNVLTDVVTEVRAMETVTGDKLAKAFQNSFNKNINNGGAVTVKITDLSSNNISFEINATENFNTPISLASDLGLPALGIGMESTGNLDANFDFAFDFAFGLNDTDGFYIQTDKTNLNLNAGVNLSNNFSAKGNIGFLQLDFANGINTAAGDTQGTGVNSTFDIGLKDANNQLTVTELQNLRQQGQLSSILDYGFGGDAALDMDVVTSVKGSTALPSYSFNLFSDLPLFNYTNADSTPPQPTTLSLENTSNVTFANTTTAKNIKVKALDNGNATPGENIRLTKGTELIFTWGTNNKETVILDKTVSVTEGSATDTTISVKLKNGANKTINTTANAKLEASAFNVAFNNINLDFGSFVTGVVSPVVDFLSDVIEPITPVVSALNEPIGFLNDVGLTSEFDLNGDGQANIIEVAGSIIEKLPSRSGKAKIDYIQFFDAIVGVTELVGAVKDLQSSLGAGNNFAIDFGSYTLQNFQGASPTTNAADVNPQTQGSSQLSSNTKNQSKNKGLGKQSLSQKVDKMFGALDKLGIGIPVLEDPFTAINLFLGNDIDLITYDMPALDIQYEINNQFAILNLPPVDGLIQGEFSVFSDLNFGLDTVGFSAWEKTGFDPAQSYLIFDGLYLSDVDPDTGVDVDELSVDATLAIGAKLNAVVASATVLGGITGEVGLDVVDIGEYTGQSDGKIRGSEVFSRINNPLSLFELAGSIDAFFRAIVKVGVDLGFFEITKTVYDKELARIPIFDFTLGGAPGGGGSGGGGTGSAGGTVASGYIDGATVFLDTNFNLAPDPLEPTTTTDELGNYNLEYELGLFDANENGKIDDDEGQIVAVGGVDVTTGLPLAIPLVANVATGTLVTPITTIKTGLEKAGLDVDAANNILSQTLGLGSDLDDFDPYEAEGEEFAEGVSAALSHILLHSLIVNGSAFLKGAGFSGNSADILTDAIVAKLSTEDEVELEEKADIEEIFNAALQETGIDGIDPKTVSNVATLVGSFNDFIEDLLEIEDDDDDDDDDDKEKKPKSVNDVVPTIAPFKHLLLGELPELTEQLTRGELTLDEVYESLDAELNETGYQLRVVEEVEEEDGVIEIETEFIIEQIAQGAKGKIANIEGATVFLDTNFNEKLNGKEPSTVTDERGNFVLDFENAKYDKNGNNKLDPDEGQIVVIGGVDAVTGLPLETPLIANAASANVVSGLTTVKVGLERLGVTSLEAGKTLNRILELEEEDLESFNPYKEKGDDFDEGIDGVAADILMKSLLVNGDALLKNAGFSGNSFDVVLQGIAQKFNSAGNNFRLKNANQIQQVFEEILTVAEITVAPEVVEGVAELVNSFNGLIGDILEEKKDGRESVVNRSLGQIVPLQEMLLGELPKVTRRLTRGNITVDEAFESVSSQLSEKGFDFAVKKNGKATLDFTDIETKGSAENDTLGGSGGDDTLIGGGGNDLILSDGGEDTLEGRVGFDHLLGGDKDDVLSGGIGRDRLNGGPGNDTLIGGASIDRFIFATNREFDAEVMGSDRITDFNPDQDIILLDKKTFTELESVSGDGFSVETEFAVVTKGAATSEAFIVYHSGKGKLFYNENGSEPGFGEGGEFATLVGKPVISADDFFVR